MNNPWTMEMIDTLRRMWIDGASSSQIGAVIGKSKNSVIGKAHRLDLPRHDNGHFRTHAARAARKRWDNTPRTPREPKPQSHFSLRRTNPKTRKPPMFLRVVSVPESQPVSLMERTGCCYPTTTEGPHLFCNLPTAEGDYCPTHLRVMYPKGRHRTCVMPS